MLQTEVAGPPPLDQRLETLRRRWFWMSGAFAAVVLVSAGMAFVSLTVAAWTFVIGASGVFMSSAVIVHDLFAEDSNKAKRIWDRDFRYRQTLARRGEPQDFLQERRRIRRLRGGEITTTDNLLTTQVMTDVCIRQAFPMHIYQKRGKDTPHGASFLDKNCCIDYLLTTLNDLTFRPFLAFRI